MRDNVTNVGTYVRHGYFNSTMVQMREAVTFASEPDDLHFNSTMVQMRVIQTTLTAPIRQEWILSGTVSLAIVPEKTRLMGGLMLTDFKQRSYFVKTDMSLKAWEGGVSLPVWRWCRKRERGE